MAVYKESIMFIAILFIIFGFNYVSGETITKEQGQRGDYPEMGIPVGKPLISFQVIHNLSDSTTKAELVDELVETTLVPLIENSTSHGLMPEDSSSNFISDYFSFIEEYPDYLQRDFSDDEEEDDEEASDAEQEIESLASQPTISFREDCQCGLPAINRIVGGGYTNIKKYPWNVQILLKVKAFPFCGGSIINSLYILTAAHCLEDLKAADISVRVGHTNAQEQGIIVDVLSIRMHEQYNSRDVTKHDIGLIRLKEPLNFTDKVLPVCLHTRANYANVAAIVTGWGRVSENGRYSDTLKHAAVKVYEYGQCRKISKYGKRTIHPGVLCARRKRTDACQGDSGGPLAYYEPAIQRFVIIGITSYGIGCARFIYPGIYTKVVYYNSWILNHSTDSTYCPVNKT